VPTQHGAVEPTGFTERQDTFEFCGLRRACERGLLRLVEIGLLFVGDDAIEEGGRRELFVVADDDDLRGPRDET
jgi:hypothetical protein